MPGGEKLEASQVELRQLALPCINGFASAEGFIDILRELGTFQAYMRC